MIVSFPPRAPVTGLIGVEKTKRRKVSVTSELLHKGGSRQAPGRRAFLILLLPPSEEGKDSFIQRGGEGGVKNGVKTVGLLLETPPPPPPESTAEAEKIRGFDVFTRCTRGFGAGNLGCFHGA